MLKSIAVAVFLMAVFLHAAGAPSAICGPSPEKGWVKFLDTRQGFCFWHPLIYKSETASRNLDFPKDRQILATLVSSEQRKAFSDDKERSAIRVCLLPGRFDLQKLIVYAPTGYDTPPVPKRYGANVFYYYGRGGGGVAYPDRYYFNLYGRALQIMFDGPYRRDSNSPTDETRAVEKGMLSSFRAVPR